VFHATYSIPEQTQDLFSSLCPSTNKYQLLEGHKCLVCATNSEGLRPFAIKTNGPLFSRPLSLTYALHVSRSVLRTIADNISFHFNC